jgi:hypothetical protein
MDWHEVIFVLLGLLGLCGGVIQLGMLRNQIGINTLRLNELENKKDEFMVHSSDTNARWPDIERRINRLETILNHVTIKTPRD